MMWPIFECINAFQGPACIGVCELDLLRDERIVNGEKLKSLGVKIEIKVYPRAPHLLLELGAALKVGRAASRWHHQGSRY
ncbi:hypothetical protein EDB19DRAFT_1735764 [Suillus lakei]|nr:hypothetical protein EDB19DRAFT_1735764 [Suillus lakei]